VYQLQLLPMLRACELCAAWHHGDMQTAAGQEGHHPCARGGSSRATRLPLVPATTAARVSPAAAVCLTLTCSWV
jgi:hypothetical protein